MCGGLVSVGIKTLILCYTILNIKKLINYEDDKYISVTWATNSTYLGEVSMDQTDVYAIELAKAREETSLSYHQEARRYVRAYAYNKKWGKDPSTQKVEMRLCNEEDFNKTKTTLDIFKELQE